MPGILCHVPTGVVSPIGILELFGCSRTLPEHPLRRAVSASSPKLVLCAVDDGGGDGDFVVADRQLAHHSFPNRLPPSLLSFDHAGLPMALSGNAPDSNTMPIAKSPKGCLKSGLEVNGDRLGWPKRNNPGFVELGLNVVGGCTIHFRSKMICCTEVDDREEGVLLVVGVVGIEQVDAERIVPVVEVWESARPGDLRCRVGLANLTAHRLCCLQNIAFTSSEPEVTDKIILLRMSQVLVQPSKGRSYGGSNVLPEGDTSTAKIRNCSPAPWPSPTSWSTAQTPCTRSGQRIAKVLSFVRKSTTKTPLSLISLY